MSLNYSWEFANFKVQENLNGLTKVVVSVDYILTAHDGNGHGDQVSGTINLPQPDPLTFTQYEHLTQPQIETWVTSVMGTELDSLKSLLEDKIAGIEAPPTINMQKPW